MKRTFALSFLLILTVVSCTNKQSSNNFPGYILKKTEYVEPISSEVVEMEHKKSGATVVLIKNKDQARSFMVGFRTPPYDDTGLFHIFEHAVLEGSRLYPSKSNFFHLANSSVASFINAMTGPVYTLYPIVTRSDKDFDNLLSVYMDAVFFPNVLNDERIIRREGWRYEVSPETKKMSINGIVLSEMKGVYSSPYSSVWFQLSRNLLPDTPFSYESGGLPEKVATLTFEQIRDAHKKYYHPQNSVIYLYGDVDYSKALGTIDESFLSEFNRTEDYKRPAIPTQKNFNYETPVVHATYPAEPAPNKDFLAKGIILGEDLTDVEEDAAAVLTQAFVSKNSSPLKLRVLKEGLAQSTFNTGFGGMENGIAIVFEGTDKKNLQKIEKVLDEEVDKIIAEGFDPELLNGILNKYEFAYKEKNSNGSHKGMSLGSIVLNNWIYQDKPLGQALDFVTQFKNLRLKLKDQEFIKNFFKTHFKDNSKVRWITLTPDAEFSKKFNAGLDEQVEQALKEKPLEEYKKEDDVYKEWVAMKESPEILEKTPTLELSDIKADEPAIEFSQQKMGDTEVLLYPQDTSGISYVTLYFDLHGLDQTDLKNLDFFTSFITKTDSRNMSFKEIEKRTDTFLGGLGFGVETFQSVKNQEQYRPTLVVAMKFINDNMNEALDVVQELLTGAQFTPESRLSNLLDEMKTGMVSGVSYRAPSLSMSAATKSFFPTLGAFNEEVGGGVFENYVLKSKFNSKSLSSSLQKMRELIFNENRMYLVSVTSAKKDLPPVLKSIEFLKNQLPKAKVANKTWSFDKQENYDGYAIPGEVQYLAQATSYQEQGLEYDGSMLVYSRYLNNNYMTPKLREQAGAYGGGAAFSRNGLFQMSTYRDPNLDKSFQVFDEAVNFMKNEKFTAETLKPAILGSLKPYYSDQSIAAKTATMTGLYLTDQSWDDYLRIKKQIMQTTPEQMQKISDVLSKALPKSKKGVAGNSSRLKKEAGFLKNVLSLQ